MADGFTQRRFAWLDQVAADPKVSPTGFVLAYRIAKFFNRDSGEAWPAQPTLAAAMRMDTRSVRRLCDQLEAAGHLQVIASRGRGHSCRYRPILHAEPESEPEPEAEGEPEIETAIATPAPEPQDSELFPDSETAPKPARRAKQDLTADFEAFWLQYPRRVSKGAAAKSYDRARKSGATANELEIAAMRYSASRTNEDPKYTKHASTWLNNQCWLDEPELPRGANFGERPQFQRQAPLSHVEIALAGLRNRDE